MKTADVLNYSNDAAISLKGFDHEEVGDEHLLTGMQTPMRSDAFKMSDEEKKQKIAHHFSEIMETLGLDLTDD